MQPNVRVVIARAEKTTLYSTLIPTFRKILKNGLKSCELFDLYGGERRPQEVHYRNGSHILFTGADNDKIFGGEFSIIYLNELRLLDDTTYSDIAARLRGGGFLNKDGEERYLLVSDTNPGGANHWIKSREVDNRLVLIPTTLEDNPQYFQNGELTIEGKEYKRVLLESYGTTGWQYDRYVLGLWRSAEGVIWGSYDSKVHDIEMEFDDIPKDWTWSGSADYGINHPCVYGLWATSPDNKQTWLFKEIYKTGLTEYRLGEEIQKLHAQYDLGKVIIVGDTAGDGNQTLEEQGLLVENANKDVLYGLDVGKQWFDGRDGKEIRFNKNSLSHPPDPILIGRGHPTKTTEEIPEYSYKPIDKQTTGTARDELPDKPKGKDDGCDQTRYHLVRITQPGTHYTGIIGVARHS